MQEHDSLVVEKFPDIEHVRDAPIALFAQPSEQVLSPDKPLASVDAPAESGADELFSQDADDGSMAQHVELLPDNEAFLPLEVEEHTGTAREEEITQEQEEDTFFLHSPARAAIHEADTSISVESSLQTDFPLGDLLEDTNSFPDGLSGDDNESDRRAPGHDRPEVRQDKAIPNDKSVFPDPFSVLPESSEPFLGSDTDNPMQKPEAVGPVPLIEVPDELDEEEFNVDDEFDAQFATYANAFQTSSSLRSPPSASVTALPVSAQAKSEVLHPSSYTYAPITQSGPNVTPASVYTPMTPYLPTPPVVQNQAEQSGLFMPVQVTQTISIPAANAYSNTSTFSALRGPPIKTGAPSFVSGKAAYTDPYAMPDTLVVKKRIRPQARPMRSVASVPNLKSADPVRPPSGHRTISAALPPTSARQSQASQSYQTQSVTDRHQLSHMSGLSQSPILHDQQTYQQALPPGQRQSSASDFYSDHPNPPPERVTGQYQAQYVQQSHTNSLPLAPVPQIPSTTPRVMANAIADSTVRQPSPGLRSSHNHRYTPNREPAVYNAPGTAQVPFRNNQTEVRAYPDGPSGGQVPYNAGEVLTHRPPASAENLYHEDNSPDIPKARYTAERQASEVSTRSEDSDAYRKEVYGQYVQDQRGAETRMLEETYAVAEDGIHEAQSAQRLNLTGLRSQSAFERHRPYSSPNPETQDKHAQQSGQFENANANGSRRSLDELPAPGTPIEIGKPSSHNVVSKYAKTEPPSSPRHNTSHLGDLGNLPKGQSIASRRPPPVTRATSSSLSYTTFAHAHGLAVRQEVSSETAHQNSFELPDHPIAAFGFGGKLLTTIPKLAPRFPSDGFMTSQVTGPGLVSIRTPKGTTSEDILGEFPGPLMYSRIATKQRRSDLVSWLVKRIESVDLAGDQDKVLLYQVLMLLIEHDGAIANPSLQQKLVRLLCPAAEKFDSNDMANFKVAGSIAAVGTETDGGRPVAVTTLTETSIERISEMLLRGDSDGALRFACDKHLWAHAMAIAIRTPQAMKNVIREFTEIELNNSSEAAESLKFLYQAFAGATNLGPSANGAIIGAPRNWRKSLAMILNNNSSTDDAAIISLAQSLVAHGQVIAAHTCFLVCAKPAIGPQDDPKALFTMIGYQDLVNGGWTSGKSEAVVLSEIYEFSVSLAQPKFLGLPHLLAFKLQRAHLLTDAGLTGSAKKYCEAITNSLKALPKGTAYLNHVLVGQLRDLTHRLDQSPGNDGSSWFGGKIARPKIDGVWGVLDRKFSQFVAGEVNDGSTKEDSAAQGPFGKLAQTPGISRVQSYADLRHKTSSLQQSEGYGGYETEPQRLVPPFVQPDQSSYPYAAGNPSSSDQDSTKAQAQFKAPYPVMNQSMLPQGPNGPSAPQRNTSYGSTYVNHAYVASQGHSYESGVLSSQAPPVFQSHEYQNHPNVRTYAPNDPGNQNQGHLVSVPVHETKGAARQNSVYAESSAPAEQLSAHEQVMESTLQPADENRKAPTLASDDTSVQDDSADKQPEGSAEDKKAGWLGGWFGGGSKKKEVATKDAEVKIHKAKLGESMSLKYDEATKRWINPKGTMPEDTRSSAPPPPMARKAISHTVPPVSGNNNVPATVPVGTESIRRQSENLRSPIISEASPVPTSNIPQAPPSKKVGLANDDLASILEGPISRRAASGTPAPGPGSTAARGKRGKSTKKYVDIFSEG